ncbi:MAG: hypothetical protein ABIR52_07350 [Casimicrobiaceae bacterium]
MIRAGPEGIYWRAADGVEVRVAAAEREPDAAPRRQRRGVAPVVRLLLGGVFAR